MTRYEIREQRKDTLRVIQGLVSTYGWLSSIPSYKRVAAELNHNGMKTIWGNDWTPKRAYRFLQRMGYSGLHGINEELQGRPRKILK
jgi:hypothetical protein